MEEIVKKANLLGNSCNFRHFMNIHHSCRRFAAIKLSKFTQPNQPLCANFPPPRQTAANIYSSSHICEYWSQQTCHKMASYNQALRWNSEARTYVCNHALPQHAPYTSFDRICGASSNGSCHLSKQLNRPKCTATNNCTHTTTWLQPGSEQFEWSAAQMGGSAVRGWFDQTAEEYFVHMRLRRALN